MRLQRFNIIRIFGTAAKWLVPSAVAACAGAIAAGSVEAPATGSIVGAAATIGFVAVIAIPMLLAGSALARLLWWGWRPRELDLVALDGSAPRLAGWLGALTVSAAALCGAMFHGTALLVMFTKFNPETVVLAEPTIALGAAIALVLTSRPLARGMTALAQTVDRLWRTRELRRRSLLTVPKLISVGAVGAAAIGYIAWQFLFLPQLGDFDASLLYAPAIAIGVLAIAHAAWLRLPRRIIGWGVVGIAAISIGCALMAWRAFPSLALAIWGECPVAGFAVERIFGLDSIRARVPLGEFKPSERVGAVHRDIVLITIDTVRADHTPPYGGSADMPVLRALASRGAVFDWAYSPSNVTRRSIPSMIIGLGPDRIRGRVVGWALRLDPRYAVVAERLRAGGYDTAGFMCCKGFWGNNMRTGLERGLAHLEIEPNGLALARRARAWIAERDKNPHLAPLFVWIHLLEPHNWAVATGEPRTDLDNPGRAGVRSTPEQGVRRWIDRNKAYDRALAASDIALGEVLNAFSSRDPQTAPIVIATSDHGESLGDHGQPFHSTDLYNSQIRVPLVIAGPGIAPSRIGETVSLTGLTPTLLELAGFSAPAGPSIDGISFADLTTGARLPDPNAGIAFSAMIRDRSNPGGVTALVRGPWKLIDGPHGFELYDRRNDVNERSNVRALRPREFAELVWELARHRQSAAQSPFATEPR